MILRRLGRCVLPLGVALTLLSACAFVPNEPARPKVPHGFILQLDSGTSEITNIEYSYGDLGRRTAARGRSGTTITSVRGPMAVPDSFYISWSPSGEGTSVTLRVPVRSKLPEEITNKTIVFVINEDRVEAYLVGAAGERRERFY